MKSLALAVAAAALIAVPAFAADTTPSAATNSTPASVTALNPAQHTFKIGQHIPAGFLSSKNLIKDPEKYGLAKPELDHQWLIVENNAYLINTISDTVEQLGPVKAQ